jgi:hypothetical protein
VAGTWLERPLPVFPPDAWPLEPTFEEPPVALPLELPPALKESLAYAADECRLDLHGAWLDVDDPNAHYVMACNGSQMFTANSFHFGLKESLLVPYHRFLQGEGFQQDGPWRLSLRPKQGDEEACLQLASDHWTFVTRVPEARLRNWKASVPTEARTRIRFSDDAVTTLLELLPRLPMADSHLQGAEFHFTESFSTVTGRAKDHHSTVELVGLKVDGHPLRISVNRTFVLQALKLGLRELELNDALSPLTFKHGGRRLVVMPLRLGSEETPPTAPAPANPTNEMPAPPPEPTEEPETPAKPQLNPEPQTTTPTPEPMSKETQANPEASTETVSALRQAIAKVEGLKDGLKAMLTDLNDVLKVLNVAQKEQRASEREVEEVRAALEAVKKLRL